MVGAFVVSRPAPAGDGGRGGVRLRLSWVALAIRASGGSRVIRPDLGPGPVRGVRLTEFRPGEGAETCTGVGAELPVVRLVEQVDVERIVVCLGPGRFAGTLPLEPYVLDAASPDGERLLDALGRRLVASRRATALVAEPRRDALPGDRHHRSRLGHHRRRGHHAPGPPVELVPTPARRPRRPGRHRSGRPPSPLTPHRPCHPNHHRAPDPRPHPPGSRPNVARVRRRSSICRWSYAYEPERRCWKGVTRRCGRRWTLIHRSLGGFPRVHEADGLTAWTTSSSLATSSAAVSPLMRSLGSNGVAICSGSAVARTPLLIQPSRRPLTVRMSTTASPLITGDSSTERFPSFIPEPPSVTARPP